MALEFTSPESLDAAFSVWNAKSRWFAGGTDLVPGMRLGLARFTRLVNLKQISELRGIAQTDEGVRIGALTTLTEISESQLIRDRYATLAQACDVSASPQLRNVATIGGNLVQDSRCPYYRGDFNCWLKGGETCYMREGENREAAVVGYGECVHVLPSDPANALVALDAIIGVRGPNGAREIAAADFFTAPANKWRQMAVIERDELVTHIQLPRLPDSLSVYIKEMDRAVWAFALVSAAVRLDVLDGMIAGARIILGGVAPVPWREGYAEKTLIGEQISRSTALRAAEECMRAAQPLAQNAYKVALARTLVRRAVMRAGKLPEN